MRWFNFLLLFVFLPSFVSAQCAFYLIDAQSDFSALPANIFPGDTVSLSVPLKNISDTCTAKNVVADISLNGSYFEAKELSDSVPVISSGDVKPVVFKFRVKDDALPGSYKFSVKLVYDNGISVVEEVFEFVLDVKACYSLDVDNVSYNSDAVYAGQKLVVFADVKNVCSGVARDVSVELKPLTNTTFDPFVLLSSNFLQVGDILPGESKGISFSLRPTADAAPDVYMFSIDANCFDCTSSFRDKISFEVLAKPELIFSGIDFSNETRGDIKNIFPGDSFSFSVQLDNIGKEKAKAVKVLLFVDGQIAGSKEDFVGNIDPDDSGAAIFDLIVLPAAKFGSHDANLVVEYIDETGLASRQSTEYSFFVNQQPVDIGGLIFVLVLVAVILVVLYFIIRMVFRQLAMGKGKLR